MNELKKWLYAKNNVHDASGIDEPERWLWELIGGVYYPSAFIKEKL